MSTQPPNEPAGSARTEEAIAREYAVKILSGYDTPAERDRATRLVIEAARQIRTAEKPPSDGAGNVTLLQDCEITLGLNMLELDKCKSGLKSIHEIAYEKCRTGEDDGNYATIEATSREALGLKADDGFEANKPASPVGRDALAAQADVRRYAFLRDTNSLPYFEGGKWRIPYLMNGDGGFGGGVAEYTGRSFDEVVDVAISRNLAAFEDTAKALASASHAKTEGPGAEPDYGPGWFGHNTDGTQRNALAAKSTPPQGDCHKPADTSAACDKQKPIGFVKRDNGILGPGFASWEEPVYAAQALAPSSDAVEGLANELEQVRDAFDHLPYVGPSGVKAMERLETVIHKLRAGSAVPSAPKPHDAGEETCPICDGGPGNDCACSCVPKNIREVGQHGLSDYEIDNPCGDDFK